MYNGVLVIYKEKGFTSHDVVAKLRGICKQKKIGHTGTLDPEAEGVLPVCLGNATKLCDILTDKTKEYETVLCLGRTTDTQDATGEVRKEAPVTCTEAEVRETVATFLGKKTQVPPMYSALKVNGKKLYELARAGIEVEREARPIEIFALEILEIDLPRVRLQVACSKGTYIRTLCHDIGAALGCGGHMESLKRLRVEQFTLDMAHTLTEVEQLRDAGELDTTILAVDELFQSYPRLTVVAEYCRYLQNGNKLPLEAVVAKDYDENNCNTCMKKIQQDDNGCSAKTQIEQREDVTSPATTDQTKTTVVELKGTADKQLYRVYHANTQFYGIYELDPKEKAYKPYKMFLPTEA